MIKIQSSLILLTYKGKILLIHRDKNPLIKNPWSFIEGKRGKNSTLLETILKKVQEEININLPATEFLSSEQCEETEEHLYHAALTDKEVNSIKRDEELNFGFYSIEETEKLALTDSTRSFVSKVKSYLQTLPN